MRSRGYRYQTQARWFWRFDRFLQAHPELAGEPVPVMLQHWAAARPTANHAAECERLARALTKAQHHLDPGTKPRRPDPRPGQQVARQWRRPYIYSPEEVRRLLDIAWTYPSRVHRYAPSASITCWSWPIARDCGWESSHDLQVGTITIRETKFFKSRILPLADSTLSAIGKYLEARRKAKVFVSVAVDIQDRVGLDFSANEIWMRPAPANGSR